MPPSRPWPRWALALILVVLLAVMGLGPGLVWVLPLPRRVDRQSLQIVVTLVGLVVCMGAFVLFLILDARRNGSFVDFALASAGLVGSAYMMRGRSGEGVVAGRPVKATWLPGARYQPSSLELTASCAVPGRFSATLAGNGPSAWGDTSPPLDLHDPLLANVHIRAVDQAWARGLLVEPDVRGAIAALVRPAAHEVRWLRLEPGALLLRTAGLRTVELTPAVVRPAVDALVRLAALAERAPPPAHPMEATRLEIAMRERSGLMGCVIVGAMLLIVVIAAGAALIAIQP